MYGRSYSLHSSSSIFFAYPRNTCTCRNSEASLPCDVGMRSWAPWMPCTSWPEVMMNCGIATGWGCDRSWVSVAIGAVVHEGVVETVPAANESTGTIKSKAKSIPCMLIR